MTTGSNCTKMNIVTPTQEFRKVDAIILEGTATIINKRGDILASMQNAEVTVHNAPNATWSNGEETWYLTASCSCGGKGCV